MKVLSSTDRCSRVGGIGFNRIRRIREAHLGEAVAESVARKAEGPGGLAFVAVGAAQGFANDFLFPLVEGHAVGQNGSDGCGRRGTVKANVGRVKNWAGGKSNGAFEDVFEFANISGPVKMGEKLDCVRRNASEVFSGGLREAL